MQDSISDLPIAELGLSTRSKNALLNAGINTVSDVLAALEEGDKALTGLKGFGAKSLADLKTKLQEQGLGLPKPDQDVTTPLQVLEDTLEKELQELRELEAAGPPVAVAPAPEERVPEPIVVEKPTPAAPVVAEEPAPEPTPVVAEEGVPEPEPAPKPTPAWQAAAAAPPAAEVPREAPSLIQRLRETLAQPREQFQFGGWIYGVVAAVIIIVLLLPPVSLLSRLGITGYDSLSAKASSVSHEDGITLSVDPETYTDRLSVRIKSVPQLEFFEGSAGSALKEAVEALPQNLTVKSPVYQIKSRGDSSEPVMIDVLVPNDAEPWETLDLYTWTGEEWKWIGGELHAEVADHEFLRAYATDIPESIVVVQAGSVAPVVSTPMESGDNPVSAAGGVVHRVNPTGLLLSTDGGFSGDPNSLLPPAEGYAVLPSLRNWAPGASANRGLLAEVLTTPETQEAHIANIVQLCTERGFAGVDVDYRGVTPDEQEAYGDFITALADALHAEGLQLSVVVEAPTPDNGGWDTGGYDWTRLGAVVDELKVPFPDDPNAYVEGGQAQRLLDWATGQVDRYKLRMLVSSLSAEYGAGGRGVNHISLEEALAPFGNAVSVDDVTLVETGNEVAFDLSGRLLGITPIEAAGTYRLEYEDDNGGPHTVFLGTAENLAVKLRWAQRYNLGGIVVADILNPGNAPGIADTVRTATAPPVDEEMQIVWTVTSETATIDQQTLPLTEPGYTWMVLASSGDYTVKANIAGFDHGAVPVAVGTPEPPEPEVTEVVTSTEDIASADGPPAEGDAPPAADEPPRTGDCVLDAAYAADVTIPDNTQLDNDEEFEKTWRVKNTGDCAWPEDTVIAFADNAQMGAPDSVEVGAVEPGADVEITVPMKAPTDAGQYTGVWQMKAEDEFFGGQLTVVILAGEVTAPVAVVAPVSGGSFELGGHVRDTGHPYADKMHYAGMNWTKVQVHYGQDVSGLVQAAHAKGFKIQLSALGSAGMVTSGGFEQDFANWVAQMASTGADAIEVWNEPNIDREWQKGHISPQAYTNLLCASYNAIKAANAGTAVISAAPAPTGFFGGCGPDGCDDAFWIAGLRDAGAANCMDYIGAHHNAGATSPSARSGHPADPGDAHHSWYFLPQTQLYYNTFGGARKLFYTEMGYASQEGVPPFSNQFAWARGTNNAQQAAWLAEAASLGSSTGMVRCIIVWNIDYVRYGDDPQDGFAIVRPDGSCPACDTLHNVLGTR